MMLGKCPAKKHPYDCAAAEACQNEEARARVAHERHRIRCASACFRISRRATLRGRRSLQRAFSAAASCPRTAAAAPPLARQESRPLGGCPTTVRGVAASKARAPRPRGLAVCRPRREGRRRGHIPGGRQAGLPVSWPQRQDRASGEPPPDLFAGVQAPSGLGCSPGLAEPGEHVWAVPTSSSSQAHGLAQDTRGILPGPRFPALSSRAPAGRCSSAQTGVLLQ